MCGTSCSLFMSWDQVFDPSCSVGAWKRPMDALSTLVVRFHFSGEFINDDRNLHYLGWRRNRTIQIEMRFHCHRVQDICETLHIKEKGTLLHWVVLGKRTSILDTDPRVLTDNKSCQNVRWHLLKEVWQKYFLRPESAKKYIKIRLMFTKAQPRKGMEWRKANNICGLKLIDRLAANSDSWEHVRCFICIVQPFFSGGWYNVQYNRSNRVKLFLHRWKVG